MLSPEPFWKNTDKLSNDTQVNKPCTCSFLVRDVSVSQYFGISKMEFSNFSGTERLKQFNRFTKFVDSILNEIE